MRTPFHDIFKTRYPSSRRGWALMTRRSSLQQLPSGGSRADLHGRHGIVHAPGIGEYKYSAIFGEGTPEQLIERSMNRVLEDIRDSEEARFGVNIPYPRNSSPRRPVSSATWWIVFGKTRGREEVLCHRHLGGDPMPWSVHPGESRLDVSVPIKQVIPEITWCHVVPSVRAARRARRQGSMW